MNFIKTIAIQILFISKKKRRSLYEILTILTQAVTQDGFPIDAITLRSRRYINFLVDLLFKYSQYLQLYSYILYKNNNNKSCYNPINE